MVERQRRVAGGAVRDLDARHQARRRRPRAAERAVGDSRRVEGRGARAGGRSTGGSRARSEGALAPDPNEEYLIYQTLVGAWPFESRSGGARAFTERIVAYVDEGAARGEGAYELAEPRRGVRSGRRTLRRAPSSIAAGRSLFLQSFQPVAGTRRAARDLQQPGAAVDQDHRARACPTSIRAPSVGPESGRSRTTAGRSITRHAAERSPD